jgi:hypothetical protein
MASKSTVVVLFAATAAFIGCAAFAQEAPSSDTGVSPDLTGTGKAGAIPIWSSATKLGNSVITESKGGIAVNNTNTSGGAIGVNASTADATGSGVFGQNLSTTGFAAGVTGVTDSATDGAVGVWGEASATTGIVYGVGGISSSPNGFGVEGVANGTGAGVQGINSGVGGWGVKGADSAANSVGVEGDSPNVGVRGQSLVCGSSGCTPQTGVAGQFIVASGGTLLYGFQASSTDVWTGVFRVDSTGKGFFDGGTQTGGADFAESVSARSAGSYGPGDLLVLDTKADRQLTLTNEPYSTLVAGIYSTKPGVLATTHKLDVMPTGEIPLAVVGIVPCKVSTENGPIQRGDLLVTSSKAGYAMKGTDRGRMLGAVVGKAMEPLDQNTGVIQVLVTLQ